MRANASKSNGYRKIRKIAPPGTPAAPFYFWGPVASFSVTGTRRRTTGEYVLAGVSSTHSSLNDDARLALSRCR
jgi:hypothetical protein